MSPGQYEQLVSYTILFLYSTKTFFDFNDGQAYHLKFYYERRMHSMQ